MQAAVTIPSTGAANPVTTSDGMTFGAMKAELLRMIGQREDATTRLGTWINLGYIDLATSLKLEELRGSMTLLLGAATGIYRLPAEVFAITTMTASSGVGAFDRGSELRKIDLGGFRALPDSAGKPKNYIRYGGALLGLHPIPDREYTTALDYLIRPAFMTQDGHYPILPSEWHEGILLSARAKAFDALMEFDKVGPATNSVVSFVRRKLDKMAVEDDYRIVRSQLGPDRAYYTDHVIDTERR
jgi:hypothetical protein